jgi:DNA-binding CsgD family transcriptional regulator
MSLSVHTVRNHLQAVMRKLDAHSRLEAVAKAVRRGLIHLS